MYLFFLKMVSIFSGTLYTLECMVLKNMVKFLSTGISRSKHTETKEKRNRKKEKMGGKEGGRKKCTNFSIQNTDIL
jgi:hypothetical protein